MNRTQLAVAELLAVILAPFDPAREDSFERQRGPKIYRAAEKVRKAQADDEYASWQVKEQPRCDAS
jgi:hypothetical protein